MRKFNHILFSVIFLGYAGLLLKLIASENLKYYVSPKMNVFMYFFLGMLFLLSLTEVLRFFKAKDIAEISCGCGGEHHNHNHKRWLKNSVTYFFFVVPLVFGFALSDQSLDSSLAEKRLVQNTNQTNTGTAKQESEKEHEANGITTEEPIVITSDNFLYWVDQFITNIDEHVGRKVETIGFVFHNADYFNEDEKFVVRYTMTCCAADAYPEGVVAKGELIKSVPDDTWVRVTGTLAKNPVEGFYHPIVLIDRVETIETPDEPYIYLDFSEMLDAEDSFEE
ncbi:TIGR03943 family protein (plasmid) [Pontibacillus sp. ALD_SL1]|uniref:TIGR03943 family putative permease subunit n=1 Tax=Pontibacillus sp. ALD_SL1 TaxID=2777185 RepID=UPI001A9568E5|nr:TIGR03943 family protein [Pontibacillus sp. ALD_SL1]QST02166.1 TIGR03943 family protein [Pontibacillus sp. ALD_SL1]